MNSQYNVSTILMLLDRLKLNIEYIPAGLQGRFKNESTTVFSKCHSPLRTKSQVGLIG